jgi:hypothetical protein
MSEFEWHYAVSPYELLEVRDKEIERLRELASPNSKENECFRKLLLECCEYGIPLDLFTRIMEALGDDGDE